MLDHFLPSKTIMLDYHEKRKRSRSAQASSQDCETLRACSFEREANLVYHAWPLVVANDAPKVLSLMMAQFLDRLRGYVRFSESETRSLDLRIGTETACACISIYM